MSARWKRNAVVAVMAVLVCSAVALNWIYTGLEVEEAAGGKLLGEAQLVSGKGGETGQPGQMCIRDRSGDLTAEDVAKITDITMTETGLPAGNIKIMAAN